VNTKNVCDVCDDLAAMATRWQQQAALERKHAALYRGADNVGMSNTCEMAAVLCDAHARAIKLLIDDYTSVPM
jgi:hypothetical protein